MNKSCIIAAVGKDSLHRNWINKNEEVDLHLIVYDDSYDDFIEDTEFISHEYGFKFKLIYNYLNNHKTLLEYYDYFYFPDDDILINQKSIVQLFATMKRFNLDLAQPSIANLHYSYPHTINRPGSILRYTNFVEIMQPCFSKKALEQTLWTFNESKSGWGLDFHWGEILDYHNGNIAIIDEISSIHTRPVQSNHSDELNSYLFKFNLIPKIVTRKDKDL